MPVISPRRSSNTTSATGSLYGTTAATSSSGSSATSGLGGGSSKYGTTSSYFERASSLSKALPSSRDYSSSYSSYLNSSSSASSYTPSSLSSSSSASAYIPRTSAYRSPSSASSYLSGGSSTLSSYRPSSYLSTSSNYDTSSIGRYGLKKNATEDERQHNSSVGKSTAAKRPPTGSSANDSSAGKSTTDNKQRLTNSSSSSSLARLVATCGLDLYEKYSPAHYKPNCELSRSRSAVNNDSSSSTTITESAAAVAKEKNDTSSYASLDRPRSRYSRLYSNSSDTSDAPAERESLGNFRSSLRERPLSSRLPPTGLSTSDSAGEIPTATFTLRSSRPKKKVAANDDSTSTDNAVLKNGGTTGANAVTDHKTTNGIEDASKKLDELKLGTTPTSTTAHNDELTTNNHYNNKNNNNDKNGSLDGDGDVSTSVSIKLDTQSNNNKSKSPVKVRTTSRNALPPSSPTSTRYWDRDSTRTSSTNYGSSSTNADTIKSSSDEKNEGLCGLRNIGNTCFMNSVIQCLSHTIELTRYLKAYNSMRSSGTKDEHILKEFAKLIQEMWSGNTGSVTPSDLKRAFSAKHRMYSDFNQQDAQEFLRFFLDSLHSALNSGVKGEPLKIEDHLSDNKKAELTWEWYTRIENSLIRDLFVGQLKSTLRCTTCGNTSVTFDPFWDLSVPLPSSSRCKLDACLDLFIREEVLDGDEMPTCSKCKQRRKCTKSFSIQRFPKYLVIHLKRFSETRWSKMTNIVEFPTGDRELNMAPYGANSNTNMHYSLYAISNHMGSTAGGHYVALCKHPVSKRWHEFNDNIVSGALSENHLVSSSAYILFYERA